jgi:hypothetical protein
MASSCPVTDDLVKDYLHGQLRSTHQALVWKLDGLSKYDVRRPLTATGTNLLGLVKHLATGEARYLGEVFGRPFPEPLGRWQDADCSDLWVTPGETREQIIGFYQRAWEHADATGVTAEYEEQIDTTAREAHRAKIERAAQEAAGGSHRAVGTP